MLSSEQLPMGDKTTRCWDVDEAREFGHRRTCAGGRELASHRRNARCRPYALPHCTIPIQCSGVPLCRGWATSIMISFRSGADIPGR